MNLPTKSTQGPTITARINDIGVTVPRGASILDAARAAQIRIPTLCKHPDLPPTSTCASPPARWHA